MNKIISDADVSIPHFETIENSVKEKFNKHFQGIPFYINDLESLAQNKSSHLLKFWNINITKKTKRKNIDFLLEYKFDIAGGYQTYQAIRNRIIDEHIEALKLAKDMPQFLYILIDYDESLLKLEKSPDQVCIEMLEQKWKDSSVFYKTEDPEYWSHLDDNMVSMIKKCYYVSQFAVGADRDSGMAYGNYGQDREYIERFWGFTFIGRGCKEYRSIYDQDKDIPLMMLSRPNNVDFIIDHLLKLKSY